jgi:cobalt/nickel transport system permease protein
MLLGSFVALFAVHISDGVLQAPWLVGGFLLAAAGLAVALWRLRDEEIPRIALLTAAFFVASSIHIRVGPTSWHLLLNGLVGVLLGRRAALAIALGLALQYFLLMHGGLAALGANTCIMLLPALAASGLFQMLRAAPWLERSWFRAALVGASAVTLTLSAVFSVSLLISNSLRTVRLPDLGPATAFTFHPITLAASLLLAGAAAWWAARRRLEPDFALGLLVGELTVLATIALNCLVLLLGGEANWTLTALVLLVVHLPIAVIEGVAIGFLVGFLARVQPELLGWPTPADEAPGETIHAVPLDALLAEPAADGQPGVGPSPVCEVPGTAGPAGADPGVLRPG